MGINLPLVYLCCCTDKHRSAQERESPPQKLLQCLTVIMSDFSFRDHDIFTHFNATLWTPPQIFFKKCQTGLYITSGYSFTAEYGQTKFCGVKFWWKQNLLTLLGKLHHQVVNFTPWKCHVKREFCCFLFLGN